MKWGKMYNSSEINFHNFVTRVAEASSLNVLELKFKELLPFQSQSYITCLKEHRVIHVHREQCVRTRYPGHSLKMFLNLGRSRTVLQKHMPEMVY